MRLDRFDLNLLVVLDALLEERNVTRAGERLHIGQSAASAALGRLREYFGDELLVPVGRHLELTPLARSLAEPVRDTLQRARATIARRPGFDPGREQRRFSIGASEVVTAVLLAGVSSRLAVEAPGVALDIRSPPPHLDEAFEQGLIDLLVMPEPSLARLERPTVPLYEDRQACIVWRGHSSVGSTLDLVQYRALGHVALRFGEARSLEAQETLAARELQGRRIEASVDSFATLPALVIGTQRVAMMPARLAALCAAVLPLRVLPLPFEAPPMVEAMAWPRQLEHDPAHRWLRERLLEAAAALGPQSLGG